MVILGGAGSQAGAVLGAVLVYVFLEALRDENVSGWVFYVCIALALIALLRPLWLVAATLAATVVFGFVAQAVAGAIDAGWTAGAPEESDRLSEWLDAWVATRTASGAPSRSRISR